MKKATIQTSLLNKRVQFVPDRTHANEFGWIRSVYTDSEGSPCYTIQLETSGVLYDTYAFHFKVVE